MRELIAHKGARLNTTPVPLSAIAAAGKREVNALGVWEASPTFGRRLDSNCRDHGSILRE